MKSNYQDVKTMWDKIGVGLSGLCLVHCLVLPVIAMALPWLSHWIEDERVHLLFAAVTVPVAAIALIPAFLKHRRWPTLSLGMIGAGLLLLGALGHDLIGHEWEHVATICGGFCLVVAHISNYRLRVSCCDGELCPHALR